MRNIIAIGGEPATGKTTLMRAFIAEYKWELLTPWKLVPTMYCKDLDLHIIGRYDEGKMFAGTDVCSMAISPEAKKWVSETKSNIMFEGDRLFTASFLEHCQSIPDSKLYILFIQAKQDTLDFRHTDRGDSQSEIFLKGRKTKYSNIMGNFDLSENIETFNNNTMENQGIILNRISSILKVKL